MMELRQPEKQTEPHRQSLDSSENRCSHSIPPPAPPPCPSHKKTRDLPNLTECHSCGFKVDVCTGKNALRALYSEWRVVLLCNKCFSSVQSSQICSYCFSQSSPESFRCIQCRHSVHKKCFFNYKDTAPWSYACLGSEFSVCVDCWIPKPVAISRRRRSRVKNRMIKKKGRVVIEKVNSRVLEDGNLVRAMEDVVKDANRAVEKKVEAATRAREEAMKKAAAARRAVEMANNALSLVPNGEENKKNPRLKMDAVRVVDGSELTFEMHPYMSCSPRISKSCCLLNTSYMDTSKRRASCVDSSCKTSNSRNSSEPSFTVGSSDSDSSTDLDRLRMSKSHMKTSLKDDECASEFDAGEELLKEGEGSCSDRLINFGGEDSGLELDRKQADSALHGEQRCNGQPDRYFLKYRRRNYRLKQNLDSEPKILYDKIYLESQDSAVGVPFHCSRELRTISNASSQSLQTPLQSAYESGYFREPS